MPGWAFNAGTDALPVTWLVTGTPLTDGVVRRWRAVVDVTVPGGGHLENIKIAPHRQEGFNVEDPGPAGAVDIAVDFELDPVVPIDQLTPAAYGDRLAPMVRALWAVTKEYGRRLDLAAQALR